MPKDISPEEKLLSIIKGKQNKPYDAGGAKADVKGSGSDTGSAGRRIDGYIEDILNNSFLKSSSFDPDALKAFNKYMVITLAVIALYIFFDIILVSPSRKAAYTISRVSFSGAVTQPAQSQMPIETKNYSHYSNQIAGKKIFSASLFVQTETQVGSGEAPADNLGLVGIIPGADPQAIIEDKKAQKTYYLIKGQSVNGIILEDINENKVTLNYGGKKTILFL